MQLEVETNYKIPVNILARIYYTGFLENNFGKDRGRRSYCNILMTDNEAKIFFWKAVEVLHLSHFPNIRIRFLLKSISFIFSRTHSINRNSEPNSIFAIKVRVPLIF